ncbi:MAG: hypothetical protein M1835_001407 [Candelina submexicana]|nr:MAG: hypothetical protein M1835_001407 [Candelina submexicana]
MEAPWQTIAARKQEERNSRIPKEWRLQGLPGDDVVNVRDVPRTCGLLDPTELEITESYDATSLAQAIADGRMKSVDVATAFCKRAAIAQQVTNCLTEIFFTEALARAEQLDAYLSRMGHTLGPLHGVPVSLKDSLRISGYDTSIGLAALTFAPSTETALLVQILLNAGAVLYVKTNVPQTLMSLDSVNNVFGRTLNPYNRMLTAGGSSGGEGALIAMKGSVLGVGTDVGGSIRIPAMCNTIYGLKPSAQRVPYVGIEGGRKPGMETLALSASAGPLARSLRDVELFMKVVAEGRPWERDPNIIPWRWQDLNHGFRSELKPLIGVVRTDGLIEPLPPVKKVLKEVVQALEAQGVETVELDVPMFKKCQSLATGFFSIDGANDIFDLLEEGGEPLVAWLEPRLKRKHPKTMQEVKDLHARRTELETEFLKIWKDCKGRRIDAFICPVAPHPVPPIDRWNGVSYTSSFVLLDYPAGTIPVRLMEEGDLEGELEGEALSSWDKVNRELWTGQSLNRAIYLESPLSVQVVAPKLQERRLYQAMQVVENAIRSKAPIAKL